MTLPSIKLITTRKDTHVSLDIVSEFETEIKRDSDIITVPIKWELPGKIFWKFYKKFPFKYSFKNNSVNNIVIIMIGLRPYFCFPYFLTSNKRNIYLFDAWPKSYNEIELFINTFNIKNVFFSSFQTTKYFKNRVKTNCVWIPEGVDSSQYKFSEYNEKDIDVLQFGRKYDWYHNLILEPLKSNGYSYKYEKIKGDIIFKAQNDFIAGLGRAKISICVPANITHPENAGNVSTLTNRYLQSMASKCLIIGYKPYDMNKIFSYDPIIEIDKNNPVKQLLDILANYHDYIPLIERNYQEVINNHTWKNRWLEIQKIFTAN
jgi:hypothetical protein